MTPGIGLFVGDVGADLTLTVPRVPLADEKVVATGVSDDVGGVVANAAVACQLAGASVKAVVAVGDDHEGSLVLSRLGKRGLEAVAERRTGRTCRAIITVAQDGEKRLVLVPGVSMYPSIALINSVDLDSVGWVHTAGYGPEAAAVLAERCRQSSTPWSVDLEPATLTAGLAGARAWLSGAQTVFVNQHAAEMLGAEPVEALRALGVREVVLTLGAGGARMHADDGSLTEARPAPGFPVLDTTGAGDALAGWYIGRRLEGEAPAPALAEAVTAASLSCRGFGAQSSYPTRPEVLANHEINAENVPIHLPRKARL